MLHLRTVIRISIIIFLGFTMFPSLSSTQEVSRFSGNYKTHWNNTYVKVVVPINSNIKNYTVEICHKKIWNEKRELVKDAPHGIIKEKTYFIYMTHFPDLPRPVEIEIEFTWSIIPDQKESPKDCEKL